MAYTLVFNRLLERKKMKYYNSNTKGFYENQIDGSIEITDEHHQELLEKQSQGGTIQVVEGQVLCLMPTDEQIAQAQKNSNKSRLQSQIAELDNRRIRAIAEPELKDGEQTWLEYYTLQIQELRTKIGEL